MPSPLRIVFAGTPTFAAVALESLLASPHEILAVYTQPDKPAGRGLKLTASPIKSLALAHSLPIHQPSTLKDSNEQNIIAAYAADVIVVAAYGMILPKPVLECAKFGCVNIHPSLLPRWRGAAPIQRTIFAGDKTTGVTIMQLEEGLDTGPILLQESLTLTGDETSASLHDTLAKLGADCLIKALAQLADGSYTLTVQNHAAATYAKKITKDEACIDWQQPAVELSQMIRAFNPWPVALTEFQGASLRVWFAQALSEATAAAPGTIVAASPTGIDVATGSGILRLLQLQQPGGKTLSSQEFYNAKHGDLAIGHKL